MKSKLEILNEIAETKQCKKIRENGRKILIDASTATAILLILKSLKKEENKEKFLSWSYEKMANYAFSRCKLSVAN